MQIQGKLIQKLPLQTGTGRNGEWKKQEIIIETFDKYPKKICISVWGDKIDENLLQIDKKLNISVNIESREYNNKWYTDIKAWRIENIEERGNENPSSHGIDDMPPPSFDSENEQEEWPF